MFVLKMSVQHTTKSKKQFIIMDGHGIREHYKYTYENLIYIQIKKYIVKH